MSNTAVLWEPLSDTTNAWDYSTPTGDLRSALDQCQTDIRVSSIEYGYASYHGSEWAEPDDSLGTELDLAAVLRLTDGRWAAVEAWNDYTGWGCLAAADWYIGESLDDVVSNGLTQEGRAHLGLSLPSDPEVVA